MKSDTQHLDFLISQYMDGGLDSSSRKSLEQKMVNDPASRRLYQEQREVQDVLDDWGSRIPMIDWADFDKKLAGRLQHETVGGNGSAFRLFRRFARPVAAAAALFVAGLVGYSWHAWSTPAAAPSQQASAAQPAAPAGDRVVVWHSGATDQASSARVTITDSAAATQGNHPGTVAIIPQNGPAIASAPLHGGAESAHTGVAALGAGPQLQSAPGAVTAMGSGAVKKDERDSGPAFP